MADAMNRRQPEQMLEVWNEYLSKGEAHHPLAVEDHNRVLFTSLKNHDLKAAEKAFERMRLKAEPDMVQEACRLLLAEFEDRKSTRLNSSHVRISYAVFCLKKKGEQSVARGGKPKVPDSPERMGRKRALPGREVQTARRPGVRQVLG